MMEVPSCKGRSWRLASLFGTHQRVAVAAESFVTRQRIAVELCFECCMKLVVATLMREWSTRTKESRY